MKSFKQDNKMGLENEITILEKLKTKNKKIIKIKDKYSVMDYVLNTKSKKYLFELKSRNFDYITHPTTILPINKWKFVMDYHRRFGFDGIFLFDFTDGLYYCKSTDLVKGVDYDIDYFLRNKRSDFNDKKSKYLHINITSLHPFSDLKLTKNK